MLKQEGSRKLEQTVFTYRTRMPAKERTGDQADLLNFIERVLLGGGSLHNYEVGIIKALAKMKDGPQEPKN